MKNESNFIRSNPMRTMLLLAFASLSMAFTIPGCPNVDEMNEKISTLEKSSDTQKKALNDLTNQLKIMNDEHNTMKQLVSQISTTVLEQKDAIEKLTASASAHSAAPTRGKPAPKKHR